MSSSEPARTASRRTRRTVLAALLAVGAVFIGVHYDQFLTAPPFAPTSSARLPADHHAALGEADGVVPEGVTIFDDQYPAVAKLSSDLLRALRRTTTAAAGAGVKIYVNSGWRSPRYQEQLLLEAISQYGSKEEAARWVASPGTSAHVLGQAVDIGPFRATAWLSRHGARYGLCQIYSDEAWHYELRPEAPVNGCPPKYADPTHDPRLRR